MPLREGINSSHLRMCSSKKEQRPMSHKKTEGLQCLLRRESFTCFLRQMPATVSSNYVSTQVHFCHCYSSSDSATALLNREERQELKWERKCVGRLRCTLRCLRPRGDASRCRSDSSVYPCCCGDSHMPPLASSDNAAS